MIRTHDAGTLTAANVGETVTLAGWVARRRDHGGVAFIDLREASGVAQVVIRDEAVAHSLRSEYCLAVTGEVAERPEGNANPALPSGEIEVIASEVEVLNPSAVLPFPIDDAGSHKGGDVGEEARLKHRYLDLRRSGPAAAIRLRSKVNKAARDVLDDAVEVLSRRLHHRRVGRGSGGIQRNADLIAARGIERADDRLGQEHAVGRHVGAAAHCLDRCAQIAR